MVDAHLPGVPAAGFQGWGLPAGWQEPPLGHVAGDRRVTMPAPPPHSTREIVGAVGGCTPLPGVLGASGLLWE